MTSVIKELNNAQLPFIIEMDDGIQHRVDNWWQIAADSERAYYLPGGNEAGVFLSVLHVRRIFPLYEQHEQPGRDQ